MHSLKKITTLQNKSFSQKTKVPISSPLDTAKPCLNKTINKSPDLSSYSTAYFNTLNLTDPTQLITTHSPKASKKKNIKQNLKFFGISIFFNFSFSFEFQKADDVQSQPYLKHLSKN
jgi:hypothetical protein